MKTNIAVIFALLLSLTLASCASFEKSMVLGEEREVIYFPNMKKIDVFHVVNFMNQRTSKIGIQILDQYKEPYYLNEESIKAYIQRENGENEIVYLQGEGYVPDIWEGENIGSGATVYSIRKPWVNTEHQVQIRVWIPLPDGDVQELDFDCAARFFESN
ncbi:MAG: hypothetical protein P9L94_11685 [Candidatus Hinthialibacter antarcticus]|nr:hypothetical protein [Candidatus Hinthialibacter antarcticus]